MNLSPLLPEKELPVSDLRRCFNWSFLSGVVLIAVAVTVLPASAFVPEDLARLKSTKQCPGCDLRGVDLKGAELGQAGLEGANLMGANLEGANLQDAVLDDASFENANLKKANLFGASLDNASVAGADFSGANLEDSTWVNGKVCKKGSFGVCK